MTATFELAQHELWLPAGIDEHHIHHTLHSLMGKQIDAADLYFQASHQESWSLEDSIVKDAHYSMDRGVGVRVMSGEKTGFAYSDDILLPALTQAAATARSIVSAGQTGRLAVWQKQQVPALYQAVNPLTAMDDLSKVKLLQSLDNYARSQDPRVCQVQISLAGEFDTVLIAAADGTLAADVRPLVRLSVTVVVEANGIRESGHSGGGARTDYGYLMEDNRAYGFVDEALRQAVLKLSAKPAPAGVMPVVLGPGWPGVLLHEAVGHGLEGDFNRKGTSAFSGRIGQQVASKLCTVVDDGTLLNRRGSLTVDDEGTPTQATVLIENGILRGYLQDKHNARLMAMQPTGNGRRQSYADLPMPRMTNTFMKAGQDDPADIIKSVKKGLYAVNFAGGQVDITSGKFVFSASEAYLIEDGKITHPVKGATLIGQGAEVMQRISMVGHDLALDTGIGVCGKDGQSVPVGVGQPTLKVDSLVVGGTEQS